MRTQDSLHKIMSKTCEISHQNPMRTHESPCEPMRAHAFILDVTITVRSLKQNNNFVVAIMAGALYMLLAFEKSHSEHVTTIGCILTALIKSQSNNSKEVFTVTEMIAQHIIIRAFYLQ